MSESMSTEQIKAWLTNHTKITECPIVFFEIIPVLILANQATISTGMTRTVYQTSLDRLAKRMLWDVGVLPDIEELYPEMVNFGYTFRYGTCTNIELTGPGGAAWAVTT